MVKIRLDLQEKQKSISAGTVRRGAKQNVIFDIDRRSGASVTFAGEIVMAGYRHRLGVKVAKVGGGGFTRRGKKPYSQTTSTLLE